MALTKKQELLYPCPKCGEGTITDGPKFTRKNGDGGGLADSYKNEALAWDCTQCGYRGRIEHVKEWRNG